MEEKIRSPTHMCWMTHHIPHIPHLAYVALHSVVSSPTVLEGVDEVIQEKDDGQSDNETQDTEDIIKPENTCTHPLEASSPSPPSPQFECYF
jgi:hypothetical protein